MWWHETSWASSPSCSTTSHLLPALLLLPGSWHPTDAGGAAAPAHLVAPHLLWARGGGTLRKQLGTGKIPEHCWESLTLGARMGHLMEATVLGGHLMTLVPTEPPRLVRWWLL